MRFLRYNEPKDPELFQISKVMPDRWIDANWPQRRGPGKGTWQTWRTSQFVRIHLLALVKKLGSFNRVCKELRHNIDFRRFCRLRSNDPVPSSAALSNFRGYIGLQGWQRLHAYLLGTIAELFVPSAAGIVVLDATDLPAAVRRTSKKNSVLRSRNASKQSVRLVAHVRARAASRITSLATRSILLLVLYPLPMDFFLYR